MFRLFRRPARITPTAAYQTLPPRVMFDAAIDPSMVDGDAAVAEPPRDDAAAASMRVDSRDDARQDHEPSANRIRREIVVVDASVEDADALIEDLREQSDEGRLLEIYKIDASVDGIDFITRLLNGQTDVDALHVISHGEAGAFRLGEVWIDDHSISGYAGQIASWGGALTQQADILLYGCDVAGNASGRDLVDSMAALSGADVAASDDDTGAARRGGDWTLEYHSGGIETEVAANATTQSRYAGLMAAGPAVAFANGNIDVPIGESFNFAVTFDNTGSDVGYGPFIDLLFPAAGFDGNRGGGSTDGVTFDSANYLGTTVDATTLTFGDAGGGFGFVEHPYATQVTNEQQAITLDPAVAGGTFALTFGGQTTAAIDFDESAASIQSKLEALSSINAGEISVSGGLVDGYVLVEWIGGEAAKDQDAITITGAALTGGSAHAFTVSDGDAAPQKLKVFGGTGDQLVVLQLPFGSVAPGQPEIQIDIAASLSSDVDLAAPGGPRLKIQSRSGFRFGEDPNDNPETDPTLLSDTRNDVSNQSSTAATWDDTMEITPTLMTIGKQYLGPEDETATGPNHVRQYRITVDIADGQTVSNLDIIDALPDGIRVTSIDSVSVNGSNLPGTAYTDNLSAVAAPAAGRELTVTLNNPVTGTAADNDVVVTFSFYVDENFGGPAGRVIPIDGNDQSSTQQLDNNARAVGDWTPTDSRDTAGTDNAVADPAGVEHELRAKSIAVQKTVAIIDNQGVAGASPGDTLRYTFEFQLSDYYTFGDLNLSDVFQDGQRFDFAYAPTFTITDFADSRSGNFTVRSIGDPDGTPDDADTGQTLTVDQRGIDFADDASENPASDGSTALTFDISQALIDAGATDGILQGGLTDGDTLQRSAVGTITFQTIIQDQYSDTFPSGDRSVDQYDVITNNDVALGGTVRENAEDDTNATPFESLGHTETDTSATSVTIAGGSLSKTVYAINGQTTFTTLASGLPRLQAGDVVTYRIGYDLSTSDFENLQLTDFFPLPAFDVRDPNGDGIIGDTWRFDLGRSFDATVPVAGTIEFGAGDTFYNSNVDPDPALGSDIVPAITVNAAANSIQLDFGDYDDPSSRSTRIELYVSVAAQDTAMADGLFLTNIVRVSQDNSGAGDPEIFDRIAQVQYAGPDLSITKGVVSTTSTEVQRLFVERTPTNADFRLTFDGQTTSTISNTATATDIETALQSLSTIGSGNVSVTGGPLVSGANPGEGFLIEFVDDLADTDVAEITTNRTDVLVRTVTDGPIYSTATDAILDFAAPGQTGPSFTGGVGSDDLANATLKESLTADVVGVDGGDLVKFAVVIENLGAGDAYDLTLNDLIAAGFAIPTTGQGLNLEIRDGAGNLLDFRGTVTGTDDDLFTTTSGGGVNVFDAIETYLASDSGNKLTVMRSRDNTDTSTNEEIVGDFNVSDIEALARDPFSPTLYGANETSGTQGHLGTIDLSNGAFTQLANAFGTATHSTHGAVTVFDVDGLTFNPVTGELYGVHDHVAGDDNILFRIHTSGPNAGRIVSGAFGGEDYVLVENGVHIDDIAIDNSGVMFATDATNLLEITIDEANATAVHRTVGAFSGLDDLEGLSFDAKGKLWGTTGAEDTDTSRRNSLFLIDKSDGSVSGQRQLGTAIPGGGTTGDYEGSETFYPEARGTVREYHADDGSNIIVVTYDLVVDDSASPVTQYDNLAKIARFSSVDSGTNLATAAHSDTANVMTRGFEAFKSIVGSSEAHTVDVGIETEAVIGEIIRYRAEVVLPEGSLTNLQIRDYLPGGLTFIDDGTATIAFVSDNGVTSSTLDASGGNAALQNASTTQTIAFALPDDATSRSDSGHNDNYGSGTDVFFSLGDVTNRDNDANIEYAIVEFNVLVDNSGGSSQNDRSDARRNDLAILATGLATYQMPDNRRPVVRVVEPQLSVPTLTADKSSGDAGDTITYTASFDVSDAARSADAFDIALVNSIDNDTTFDSVVSVKINGVTVTSGATYPTVSTTGGNVTFGWPELSEGDTVEVVYAVTVDVAVVDDDVISNSAELSWSSLRGEFGTAKTSPDNTTGSDLASLNNLDTSDGGEPGTTYASESGEAQGERNGSSTPSRNDHQTATAAPVQFTVDADWNVQKTLVSSEIQTTSNTQSQAVIGETVIYQVVVTFPEATAADSIVTDVMDNGLAFVRQISATADGVTVNASGLTPAISNSGRTVIWDLGTVVDSDTSDNTGGTITFVYEAVVTNVSSNQAAQDNLGNDVTYTWGNDGSNDRSASVDVDVIEPAVTLTQTQSVAGNSGATNGDAGDSVRYVIEITNASGVDAFDLDFNSVLPKIGSASAIDGVTLSVTDTAGTLSTSDFTLTGSDSTGYTISYPDAANGDWDMAASDPTRTVTLTIDGTISPLAGPNAELDHAPEVSYTSIDGPRSAASTHNAASNERGGTDRNDDTADYIAHDDARITINPPTLTKSLVSTDRGETSGSDVTIGESVTYALLITLPEGNTAGLTVVDELPGGMLFVDATSRVVTTAADSGGLLTADFAGTLGGLTRTGGSSDGEDISYAFGATTVVNDNDATNNSFVIFVTGRVTDNASNVGYGSGQTTLSNTATFDVSGDGVAAVRSNRVDVDVVESNLRIDVAVDRTHVNVRDELTITLSVTNDGLGDAYDVRLTDVLDPAIYDLSTLQITGTGTATPTGFTASFDNTTDTLSYTGGRVDAGTTETFTFKVSVRDSATLGQDVTHTADITDASTLSGNVAGERNNPDPDNNNSDTDDDSFRIRENTISGSVYFDANNNGVRDVGETGIQGVRIDLTGSNHLNATPGTDNVSTFVLTDGSGNYTFDNLHPGTYAVAETQPITATNGRAYLDGDEAAGTPAGDTTNDDVIASIVLPESPSAPNQNGTDAAGYTFGELEEAIITGVSYHDANNNGVRDAGEDGLPGVTVTLTGTDDNGAITARTFTTTAGDDGAFRFAGLRPGTYAVTQTQPNFDAGNGRVYIDGKETDGSLSNGSVSDNSIASIEILAGQTGSDYRFGEVIESTLSGVVYIDADNDGVRDAGENGIGGITVTLTGIDDTGAAVNRTVTTSTVTGSVGQYAFTGLRPSNGSGYTITEGSTSGFLDGDVAAPAGGGTVGNDVITAIPVTSDTDRDGYNFGELRPSRLSGTVFNDRNNNGTQDPGETGIGGVTLTISGSDDRGNALTGTVYTVTTQPDGTYAFENLRPSDATGYTITQTQPAAYNDGVHDAGTAGGNDSVANTITAIKFTENTNATGYDFGERGASITGRVFVDNDRDGNRDADDTVGINAVTLTLRDSGGDIVGTTTTNPDGTYAFDHLPAGTYTVTQTQPTRYTTTSSDTQTVTLTTAGSSNHDFGEALWDLGDRVYFDANNNGTFDAGDQGLVGVNLTLVDAGIDGTFGTGDDITRTTASGAGGIYQFTELFNGPHRVTITGGVPAGTTTTQEVDDVSAAIDGTSNITIAGSDRPDVDFGYVGSGVISDLVFFDGNGDGVQDTGEPGLANVRVNLTFAGSDNTFGNGDDLTFQTDTDSNGNYAFTRLPAGSFRVAVDTADADLPGQIVGVDGTQSRSGTQNVTLTVGQTVDTMDFGFTGTRTIGDLIFDDRDGDGAKGTSESGIPGVTVTIGIDTDDDGTADYTTSTVTDANGGYTFTNVPDGTHVVTVSTPGGSNPTTNHDATPGGDNQSSVTITTADNRDQDFGFRGTGQIGQLIYWDVDGDGVKDADEVGLFNIPVKLEIDYNRDGTADHTLNTTTDIDGLYRFDHLVAGDYTITVTPPTDAVQTDDPDATFDSIASLTLAAGQSELDQQFGYRGQSSIGDQIYWDVDNSGGAYDAANDTGLAGVDVSISIDFDADGSADYTAQRTTDSTGAFVFENLIAGTYVVTVDPATVPGGMSANPTHDGDGPMTPHRSNVNLGSNEADTDQDFGYTGTGRIGELVYWDANNNGSRDTGEVGLPDVSVTIEIDLNGDGDYGDPEDRTLTTTTDANGAYAFENLPATNYRVTVTPPAGTSVTDDPDANDNGVTVLALPAGTDKDDVTFGLTGTGSIGDLVFFDYRGDGGEFNATENDRGIGGVTVTLTTDVNGAAPGGVHTQTLTTSSVAGTLGQYTFDHLIAGDHTVTITPSTLPDQMGTQPTYNADATIDDTTIVTLAAGGTNRATDFGYHATPEYDITIDDGNVNVVAGEIVSYTVTLINRGKHTGRNVQVVQTYPTNVLENVTATGGGVVDAVAGTVTWTLPTVDDGQTRTFTVTGRVPAILDGSNDHLATSVTVSDDAFNGVDPIVANNTDADVDQIVDIQTVKNVVGVMADGDVWDVTFEITVQNTGSVALDDLTLLDDVNAQFGSRLDAIKDVSIDSSGVTAGVAPTLNAAWTSGNTSVDVLDPVQTNERLLPGEFFKVRFTATVDPDDSGTATTLFNSATAGGTDRTTAAGSPRVVTDASDGGTDLNSTNSGAPGDVGTENDPTRVYIADIAVAKSQVTAVQNVGNRDYVVTYRLNVENIGTVKLDDLTLTDDLQTQFGDAFKSIVPGSLRRVSTVGTGTFPVVNSNWESDTGLSIINPTGASLNPGDAYVVEFQVVVDPNGGGSSATRENTAVASGRGLDEYDNVLTQSGSPIRAIDHSDSGLDPNGSNPTAPGDAGTTDDPTPLVLPEIAAAKRLVASTSSTSGERDLTYEITIENVGTVDLFNLSLEEDLRSHLGAAFVTITTAPNITASDATVNPTLAAFDGDANDDIFAGIDGQLEPGQSITVRLTVEVKVDQLNASSSNQVEVGGDYVSAPGATARVTDLSDTGSDPAISNPGQPGDTGGHDDPTLIPAIGITKHHGDAVKDSDTHHHVVPVTLVVENLGATRLTTLELIDDLRSQLGDALIGLDNFAINTAGVTGTPPTLNSAYADDTSVSLVNGGDLNIGDTFTITFDMTVDPDHSGRSDFGSLQATVTGADPINPVATVSDRSDSGIDPAGKNAGQPGDTGSSDDATPLRIADVAVVKQIIDTRQNGLSFDMTIRLIVENTGTVDLTQIELNDDLKTQYGPNYAGLIGRPRIVSSDAQIDPTMNLDYVGDDAHGIFNSDGHLRPGQSVTVDMVVRVTAIPGQTTATLINQAGVAASPTTAAGTAMLSASGTPMPTITDWSDAGGNANTTNANHAGDAGTFDDPTPQTLTFFTFDAFNDFSAGKKSFFQQPTDGAFPRTDPADVFESVFDNEDDFIRRTGSRRLLTQNIQSLAPEPIFSGTARPGTHIVGRLYDSVGRLVGEARAIADVGGNWMMPVHGLDALTNVRVEFHEVAGQSEPFTAGGDPHGYRGVDQDEADYATLQPFTPYGPSPQFSATHRAGPRHHLDASVRTQTRPLGFGTHR